ncbi:hypothetical protein E1B28_006691 [Marasmius oreades]|uniref:Uncharacterized protein n=1 Tax=Marasmius oreades TaxID=181124 RepID=A0A9P7UWM5_9AGAR|nr:uncharacterized protein E1B28_006691 [Marasmius oreades]KAG7096009.1 hypothetical protein E1B28_006691 [Marasmius oreades]
MEYKLYRQLFESAKSRIVFSILNTVLQVALQACLIPVTRNSNEDLAGAGCFQAGALDWSDSLLENSLLISLHLLALSLHIFSVKNNSPSFAPLLLILFGLSFGSSITQLAQFAQIAPQCKVTLSVMIASFRLFFSSIFLIVLVVWMIPWRSSFIKEFALKTSICTLWYIVAGTSLVAHNISLFCTWVAFASALVLDILIRESLSRRALRKDAPPTTSAAETPREDSHVDVRMGVPSQTLPSTTYVSVGQSSLTSGPFEGPVAHSQTGPTISSKSSPEIRSSVLTAYTNSKLSTEASSVRSSIGVETFHTAVHPRSSMSSGSISTVGRLESPDREQTTIRVRDSARPPRLYVGSSPRASVAEEELQPSGPSDNEQLSLCRREGIHRPPSHRLSGSSSSAVNAYLPATRDGEDLQSQSSGEPEPAETEGMTPFPSSSSPTPPTPSVSSSTPTVPPYTEGPYVYRQRHDTLASHGTYETLPSYHSRRSSQTLAEMLNGPPQTPRHVRSLPPLPPLPPFAYMSESILSTHNSSRPEA